MDSVASTMRPKAQAWQIKVGAFFALTFQG
jgi:hypothetical protein